MIRLLLVDVRSVSISRRSNEMKERIFVLLKHLLLSISLFISASLIAATPEIELIIRDHLFFPSTLEIPAGQKVRVRIINQDPTPEEFESFELNREKLVVGNGQTVVFIGPLEPGEYPFFGEFYPKTAQGVVIVK
jgi:Cupredoxin-like domain